MIVPGNNGSQRGNVVPLGPRPTEAQLLMALAEMHSQGSFDQAKRDTQEADKVMSKLPFHKDIYSDTQTAHDYARERIEKGLPSKGELKGVEEDIEEGQRKGSDFDVPVLKKRKGSDI